MMSSCQPTSDAASKTKTAIDPQEAQNLYERGEAFRLGEGVSRDYEKAEVYYLQASKLGHTKAQLELGALYYQGLGVKEDKKKAAHWWQEAAENGDAEAQFLTGTNYERGDGVKKSMAQAIKWYEKSAAQYNSSAMAKLMQIKALGIEEYEKFIEDSGK